MTKYELEDIVKGKPTVKLGRKAVGLRQEESQVTKVVFDLSLGNPTAGCLSAFGFF